MIRLAETPDPTPPILSDAMAVTVTPVYVERHSDPPRRYVFVYFVRIENVGTQSAQLFWRHWRIHDSRAGDHEVEGEGVVGMSPTLAPGEAHEYQSFCVLEGPTGTMEGYYHFRREDGLVFRAVIPRFHLEAPQGSADRWDDLDVN